MELRQNNISDKFDRKQCTGCGACVNACPSQAISMKPDNNGFLYPVVNKELCFNCGKCISLCSARETHNHVVQVKKAYAVWSKDDDIRFASTSGGAFSEFAKYFLKNGGLVAGAAYAEDNSVEHIMIDEINKLPLIRQSKYVQSDSREIYKEVKAALDAGKKVLFCGTPCQVAAMKAYLNKEYGNLLLMSFICLGVNSPKALKAWLQEIEAEEKSKVKRVWFKYKQHGWHKSPLCTRLDFSNDTHKVYFGDDNTFMKGYIGYHLYLRPSCSSCQFKGIQHGSDIMVADFWGLENADDNGTSLLIVNSKKGEEIFDAIGDNLVVSEKDFDEAVLGNPSFKVSVQPSKYSENFLRELDEIGFSRAYKKYARESWKNIIKAKLQYVIDVFAAIRYMIFYCCNNMNKIFKYHKTN